MSDMRKEKLLEKEECSAPLPIYYAEPTNYRIMNTFSKIPWNVNGMSSQGAHHVDLRHSTSEDPEWLKDVRKQEVHIISGWISQYYHDLAMTQQQPYLSTIHFCYNG
ncbi:hypothetical protein SAY86_020768 [Trapa natans]|uniref:Uncharacterized protein n=1 Tax=Trapa natans TaxID=22666 RepID=A0AAN7RJB7_TRANT|nr:hypothetical protein SAY86_020768 [Trapa natans]